MKNENSSQLVPPNSQLSTFNSQLPKGYKQTEVGVIPEDWDVKTVSQAGDVLGGRQRSPSATGEPTKYLRVANVFNGYIDFSDVLEMPFSSVEREKFSLRDGDILLNEGQSINLVGRSAIYHDEIGSCCFQNTLIRFRASKNTCIGYAQEVFQYYLEKGIFASIALQTTSIDHLGAGRFATLKIALPPIREQRAIAEALSDADALIESLEQLITKKRHLKQGATQELLRPKHGWIRRKLGDLATIQRGASPRPIDSPIWFDDNSSLGWVRISDVTHSGMYLRETTQRLSPLGIQNSRRVNRGSLIMSICATVGRPIITQIDICIHDGFVVFDSLRASQKFLYYILKSIEGDWSKHGQTGSQMNLNTGLINQTEMAIPKTKEEQEEIAEIFSSMDTELDALETRLTKTRQLKQGMMHVLLTGRVRLV